MEIGAATSYLHHAVKGVLLKKKCASDKLSEPLLQAAAEKLTLNSEKSCANQKNSNAYILNAQMQKHAKHIGRARAGENNMSTALRENDALLTSTKLWICKVSHYPSAAETHMLHQLSLLQHWHVKYGVSK